MEADASTSRPKANANRLVMVTRDYSRSVAGLTLVRGVFTISYPFDRRSRLRLSKRTEYGLRAVVQLARLWPRNFVQAKDLAVQEDLPNKFLESILLALR